jgi:hypothetical protein
MRADRIAEDLSRHGVDVVRPPSQMSFMYRAPLGQPAEKPMDRPRLHLTPASRHTLAAQTLSSPRPQRLRQDAVADGSVAASGRTSDIALVYPASLAGRRLLLERSSTAP